MDLTFTIPLEWIEKFIRKYEKGVVPLRPREKVTIKGYLFEVLLISKDGVMLRPNPGVAIEEQK